MRTRNNHHHHHYYLVLFLFFSFYLTAYLAPFSAADLSHPRDFVLNDNNEYDDVLGIGLPPGMQVLEELEDAIQLIRFDKEQRVSLGSVSSLEDLLNLARQKFNDPRITRLLTRTGDPITSLEKIKMLPKVAQTGLISLVAKGNNEQFLWSALNVGDEIPIILDGRDVVVRTIATHPRLFEIENFISEAECDHIIEKARRAGLVRSKVGDDADSAVPDQSRTSSQLWVGPAQRNDDEVFERIRARVFNLTKLPTDLGEDTQVVYYDVMQHYYAHHDFTRKEYVPENIYYQSGGNRLVTVIYYLNDVEEGGSTGFPYVNSHTNPSKGISDYSQTCGYGLNLKAKKGGAAMFYNLVEEGHMDGEVDLWSLHSGCDVLKGEKWIANQWIRNKRVNGNLFSDTY